MAISTKPLLTNSFLRSVWADEYEAFKGSPEEAALDRRLNNWANRRDLGERASVTFRQQFPIPETGQDGGTGSSDLVLGWFTGDDRDVPQVVCEFKGVKGSLDSPQRRPGKAGNRTPVEQAKDYLWGAKLALADWPVPL